MNYKDDSDSTQGSLNKTKDQDEGQKRKAAKAAYMRSYRRRLKANQSDPLILSTTTRTATDESITADELMSSIQLIRSKEDRTAYRRAERQLQRYHSRQDAFERTDAKSIEFTQHDQSESLMQSIIENGEYKAQDQAFLSSTTLEYCHRDPDVEAKEEMGSDNSVGFGQGLSTATVDYIKLMRKRQQKTEYMRLYRQRQRNRSGQSPLGKEEMGSENSFGYGQAQSTATDEYLALIRKREQKTAYMRSYRQRKRNRTGQNPLEATETKSPDFSEHDQLESLRQTGIETEEYKTQDKQIPSSATLDYCHHDPDVIIKEEMGSDNSFGYGQGESTIHTKASSSGNRDPESVSAQNDFAAILKRLENKIDSIAADVKILKENACTHGVTLDTFTKAPKKEPEEFHFFKTSAP